MCHRIFSHAFAEPVDYTLNTKKQNQRAWNYKRKHIPVNYKNTELVLHVFKRILENMLNEVAVLNTSAELHDHVRFQIAQL